MYTIGSAFYLLKEKLTGLYEEREAAAIAHEVLEHITGLGKTDRLIHKEKELGGEQCKEYEHAIAALQEGVPLQYVTGKAWFMGEQYHVNEHVLIPRPETEELVQWIIEERASFAEKATAADKSVVRQAHHDNIAILDVGTGSGCIPVSLKKRIPDADVTSCDVSADALEVARGNAKALGAVVNFVQLDFLSAAARNRLGVFDVVVSNPPYIPLSEKETLHTNVRDHEPGLALFVPDNDALVFYRAIAAFGKTHLNDGGSIYCELDARHAEATKALFEHEGYNNVVLRKDIHDNQRMLRASRF